MDTVLKLTGIIPNFGGTMKALRNIAIGILACMSIASVFAQTTTYTVAASPSHPQSFGRANSAGIYAYGIPLIEPGQTLPTNTIWLDTTYLPSNYPAPHFVEWLGFDFPQAQTLPSQITVVGGGGTCTRTVSACLPSQITVPFTGVDSAGTVYTGTISLQLIYYYANVRYSGWYGQIVGGSVTLSEPL